MKKKLIPLILIFFLLLLGLIIFLVVQLGGLAGSPDSAQTETPAVEDYVREHWPDFAPVYDKAEKTLTLSQSTKLTYEDACAYGGSIYCDELAPASYLPQARSIAIDLMGSCSTSGVNVILSYESTEGTPIFTVNSSGETWACWEDGK